MGHGAAHPLIAAVLLDVGDPLLALTHDLRSLQVEVFVDHLQTHSVKTVTTRGDCDSFIHTLFYSIQLLSTHSRRAETEVLLQIETLLLKILQIEAKRPLKNMSLSANN